MAKDREALIGRAVTDDAFRRRLLADPEGTLKAEGYDVDPAVVAQLRTIDPTAADAAVGHLDQAYAERKAAT